MLTPEVQLTLTSRDKSTTYVHCNPDIVEISPLSWQGPFGGGLGKPSNYNVILGFDDLDTIKTRLPDYNRAEVTLRVDVGSETFYPHVGRVSSIKRDGFDPLKMKLQVVDRFLDDDPMIPGTSIVDSHDRVHPAEVDTIEGQQGAIQKLGKASGYPWYYGDESLRDFYMTAVDCDIAQLIGPRNVSNESHVLSLWFNSDFAKEGVSSSQNVISVNKTWAQQSGSNNLVEGGKPFELQGVGAGDVRFWKFGELEMDVAANSSMALSFAKDGVVKGDMGFSVGDSARFHINVNKVISQEIHNLTNVKFSTTLENVALNPINSHSLHLATDSGVGTGITLLASDPNSLNLAGDIDTSSGSGRFFLAEGTTFASGNARSIFRLRVDGMSSLDSGLVSMTASIDLRVQLKSAGYQRFSIFAGAADASRIAISENPLAILDHVNSQDTGIGFVQLQSSDMQVNIANSAYAFNCFFADREPAQDIFNEFGEITGTGLWLGDSGSLNFRTYLNSESVTIDRILSPADFEKDSFQIDERPIGSSLRESELARAVAVHYDYNFQRNSYDQVIRAFPGNSPACNSIDAAGVTREITEKSKYIMTTAVASLYLNNLVRLHTQDQSFVSGKLPAEHFDLELNDVLRIQNPLIVGSESLYQIVDLEHDYLQGLVNFTAGEVLS